VKQKKKPAYRAERERGGGGRGIGVRGETQVIRGRSTGHRADRRSKVTAQAQFVYSACKLRALEVREVGEEVEKPHARALSNPPPLPSPAAPTRMPSMQVILAPRYDAFSLPGKPCLPTHTPFTLFFLPFCLSLSDLPVSICVLIGFSLTHKQTL